MNKFLILLTFLCGCLDDKEHFPIYPGGVTGGPCPAPPADDPDDPLGDEPTTDEDPNDGPRPCFCDSTKFDCDPNHKEEGTK